MRQLVRRFFRQRSALLGLFIIGSLVLVAIFAPVIAPYEPTEVLIGKEDVSKRESPCMARVFPCVWGSLRSPWPL